MGLYWQHYDDPLGARGLLWITADSRPLAEVGFELVAMTLAEPLRRALDAHLAEHEHPDGFAHCDEAVRLFELLPAGDQVTIG